MDPFESSVTGLTSPAYGHFGITPSDTVDLPVRPRALVALTAGNLALRDALGVVITYPVAAGQVVDFRAVRVMATGTTATVAGWI